MLNAFASLKCSKKCEHNVQRPIPRATLPRHCFIKLICYICNNEAKSINLKLETGTSHGDQRFSSGCEGPTERLSSFVDQLLQPIAKQQATTGILLEGYYGLYQLHRKNKSAHGRFSCLNGCDELIH